MIAHPDCDCKPILEGTVQITLPEGHARGSQLYVEEMSIVACGDCGKTLKPMGTVYRRIPWTGEMGLMTIPWGS